MFIAAYRNTMRNAKPKFRVQTGNVVDLVELRRRREERENAPKLIGFPEPKHIVRRYKPGGDFDRIVKRICRALKVTDAELFGSRRGQRVVLARQAIAYWACRLSDRSLPTIGRLMERDHTTILHGKRNYPKKRAKMGRYLRELS